MNTRRRTTRAFTLIELLVVIAIIMILAGILVPGLNKAIQMGHAAKARSGVRELSAGAHAYEEEYGYFPGQKRYPRYEEKASFALGECLWGTSDPTPLNSFLPYKDEKVMDDSGDNRRVPSDRFPDKMPVLYFPSKLCSTGSSVADSFFVDDNKDYVDKYNDESGDANSLSDYASEAKNDALGKIYHYDTFLIIGAGLDRKYFTDDDITNWR
jgi:prepilin-type N-terminal cleavage/methylation domain-containing protein